MEKIALAVIIVLVVLWVITLPGRRRRRDTRDERMERKAHNSRMISYSGFETSITPEGHRRVHAKKRLGAGDCSDKCPYCAAGTEYQSQLRVFDDRLIRGRGDRRRMREEQRGYYYDE